MPMRKRTVRNGMRMLLAALLLIILACFYHGGIASLFSLTQGTEQRFYGWVMFLAAGIGAYGVMQAVFGLLLSADLRDAGVRVVPLLLLVAFVIVLYFYLFVSSFNKPIEEQYLRPGTTITI